MRYQIKMMYLCHSILLLNMIRLNEVSINQRSAIYLYNNIDWMEVIMRTITEQLLGNVSLMVHVWQSVSDDRVNKISEMQPVGYLTRKPLLIKSLRSRNYRLSLIRRPIHCDRLFPDHILLFCVGKSETGSFMIECRERIKRQT